MDHVHPSDDFFCLDVQRRRSTESASQGLWLLRTVDHTESILYAGVDD